MKGKQTEDENEESNSRRARSVALGKLRIDSNYNESERAHPSLN